MRCMYIKLFYTFKGLINLENYQSTQKYTNYSTAFKITSDLVVS